MSLTVKQVRSSHAQIVPHTDKEWCTTGLPCDTCTLQIFHHHNLSCSHYTPMEFQHSVVASGCVVHFGFQLPMSLRCHPHTPGDISSGVCPQQIEHSLVNCPPQMLQQCCLFGGTTLKVSSILSEEHFLHLVEMARIASVVTEEYSKTF